MGASLRRAAGLNKHWDIVRRLSIHPVVLCRKSDAAGAYGETFYTRTAEELKARIIGLVRKNERMTISQLRESDGSRLAFSQTLPCGCTGLRRFIHAGKYGVFTSEQVYRVWRKAAEKTTDQTLIRKLPDGEIRRYDRQQNIICGECRRVKLCCVYWRSIRAIFRRRYCE